MSGGVQNDRVCDRRTRRKTSLGRPATSCLSFRPRERRRHARAVAAWRPLTPRRGSRPPRGDARDARGVRLRARRVPGRARVATLCVYPLDVARRDLARRGADRDASAASPLVARLARVREGRRGCSRGSRRARAVPRGGLRVLLVRSENPILLASPRPRRAGLVPTTETAQRLRTFGCARASPARRHQTHSRDPLREIKSNPLLLAVVRRSLARLAARIRRRAPAGPRASPSPRAESRRRDRGRREQPVHLPFDVRASRRARERSRRKRERKKKMEQPLRRPPPPSRASPRPSPSARTCAPHRARRGVASLWRGAGTHRASVLGPAANFAAFDRLKRAFLSLASERPPTEDPAI